MRAVAILVQYAYPFQTNVSLWVRFLVAGLGVFALLIGIMPCFGIGCVWDPSIPLPPSTPCNYIWQSKRPTDVNYVLFISLVGVGACCVLIVMNAVIVAALCAMNRRHIIAPSTMATRRLNQTHDPVHPRSDNKLTHEDMTASNATTASSPTDATSLNSAETRLVIFLVIISMVYVICWLPLLVN